MNRKKLLTFAMGKSSVASKIDPLYLALLHQRHHDFEKCAAVCTKILEKNPADEAAWSLKTRALTAQVMVDDIEGDVDEGIVDLVLDDNALRAVGHHDGQEQEEMVLVPLQVNI